MVKCGLRSLCWSWRLGMVAIFVVAVICVGLVVVLVVVIGTDVCCWLSLLALWLSMARTQAADDVNSNTMVHENGTSTVP